MTEEFGPFSDSDEEPDRGVKWQLGGWLLSGEVWLLRALGSDTTFSFDRAANRISAHGESENPQDAFDCGYLAGFLPSLGVLMWLSVAYSAAQVANLAAGTVLTLPLSIVALVVVLTVFGGMLGVMERMPHMTIYDHTTEPSQEFDDLTQQYVDGEIDTDELEAQTEARLE